MSADVYEQVLSAASVVFGRSIGPADDFFSLGGDSVNAVELVTRVEAIVGEPVEPGDLWDSDTLYEFAARVAAQVSR